MRFRLGLFILSASLLSLSELVHAVTLITGIANASSSSRDETKAEYSIYGGNVVGKVGTNDAPFNSCAEGGFFKACNLQGIYPTLNLIISGRLGVTNPLAKKPIMKIGTILVDSNQGLSEGLTSGEFRLVVPWSSVCKELGNADCSVSTSKAFQVGVDLDTNGEIDDPVSVTINVRSVTPGTTGPGTASGLDFSSRDCSNVGTTYSFWSSVFFNPEDEAAQIKNAFVCPTTLGQDLAVGSDATGFNYTSIVVFPFKMPSNPPTEAEITTAFSNMSNASGSPSTFGISKSDTGDIELGIARVEGLDNGVSYCFLPAAQDQAGNVTMALDYTGLVGSPNIQNLCANPTEVAGLLADKSCFIATAAFGSPLHPLVNLLREFRNDYLLTWSGGRKLVKWYYKMRDRKSVV